MNLIQSFLTKNPCYTKNVNQVDSRYSKFQKNGPQGLMLHSIGCPQPRASVLVNGWNNPSYNGACVHAFIDGNTGDVYQTLPWNFRGWHCASGTNGSGNNTHVGVEMCEPSCIKYTGGSTFTCNNLTLAREVATRTYNSAVELFAMLCKQYKLDPMKDGVIISHKEGHTRKIASNHGDPEHLWSQLGLPYTMDTFRRDVKATMGGAAIESPIVSVPITPAPNAPTTFSSYMVKITTENLRIRKGAGTNTTIVGKIKPGVYTIIEEANGPGASKWGRLKSKVGWISLDYAKKV